MSPALSHAAPALLALAEHLLESAESSINRREITFHLTREEYENAKLLVLKAGGRASHWRCPERYR